MFRSDQVRGSPRDYNFRWKDEQRLLSHELSFALSFPKISWMPRDLERAAVPRLPNHGLCFVHRAFSTTAARPISCIAALNAVWKQRMARIGDNDNCLARGHSLVVIGLVAVLRGLLMMILSNITRDIYVSIDWRVVFGAKMMDDMIKTQVLES